MPPAAPLIGGGAGGGGGNSTYSASWFVGAPLTKLYAVATVVFYVLFHAKSAQDAMAMDSYRITRAAQFGNSSSSSSEWHRYWSSKMTFGSTGELIMGGMLLILLAKQFEREMGTRKFGLFCLLANVSAMGMEVIVVALSTTSLLFIGAASSSSSTAGGYRYQGPYAVLGALMFLYHRFTPRLHPRFFGMLGFTFSEKSFYYLWFCQVVGYRGHHTILAAALGGIAAYVYVTTSLDQTLDIPDAIAKPLIAIGAHLSEPPPRVLSSAARATVRGGGGGQRNAAAAAAAAAVAAAAAQQPVVPVVVAPPSPEIIEQLTSMGFEQQQVLDALRATNNNVERAADRLLAG